MSKRSTVAAPDLEKISLELEEGEDLDIESTDIGFLLDSEGNLKTVFGPEDGFTNPNEVVAAILDILGVDELTAPNRTLH